MLRVFALYWKISDIIMGEANRDKFRRLAEKRVNKAVGMIRLIGNLSNRSNYDYAKGDIDKVFSAIEAELKAARNRFKLADIGKNRGEFRLGE